MAPDRLPLLVSVPHGGTAVPSELQGRHLLTHAQIVADGDVGASTIYAIGDQVASFVTASIARAFVDLNRAPDDVRKDGVVKTHTCWNEVIYPHALDEATARALVDRYHRPYHEELSRAATQELLLAVDCHTMAAFGPPVGPDPGVERPWICLGNVGGRSCPAPWLAALGDCFSEQFEGRVRLNDPFRGGYITRYHGTEMPWVQLEMSRAPFFTDAEKRVRTVRALHAFCALTPSLGRSRTGLRAPKRA
ncbi:MAG: N-formylglutamate amidohydrolase [Myxococcota bacterium]